MAIRTIREMGDPILEQACKPVKMMTPRTRILIEDMLDTMYENEGVGLAAPQVGVLRRIVVIDVGDEQSPYILINPEIVEQDGEQKGYEGCLSVPGKSGFVTRPNHVKVRAFNEELKEVEYEGEGLLARAFCHELDHLDGKLYVPLAEGGLVDNSELYAEEEGEEGEEEEGSEEEAPTEGEASPEGQA